MLGMTGVSLMVEQLLPLNKIKRDFHLRPVRLPRDKSPSYKTAPNKLGFHRSPSGTVVLKPAAAGAVL
jgi:hypothetical protein